MTRKIPAKKSLVFLIIGFVAGFLLFFLLFRVALPNLNKRQIEKLFIEAVRTAPIPLAYHSLNDNDIRQLIGLLFPDKLTGITENVVENVKTDLKALKSLQYDAALDGINSDEAMVEYWEKSGLLNKLDIPKKTALERMAALDTTKHFFEPKNNFAKYYPNTPPPNPVRYPGEYEAIGAVLVSWPVYHDPLADWDVHKNLVSEIISEADAWILVPNEYWQKAVELYLEESGI
ncbi:hypothetical protein KKF59_02185, partial [Patescibacteria group bacterium]|nr:hypothetical protein [Patescibacteria group bacterium]